MWLGTFWSCVGIIFPLEITLLPPPPQSPRNNYDISTGRVSATFVNPKIKDLSAYGETSSPFQMTAKLFVEYGEGINQVFERSYPLVTDNTAPTINIV